MLRLDFVLNTFLGRFFVSFLLTLFFFLLLDPLKFVWYFFGFSSKFVFDYIFVVTPVCLGGYVIPTYVGLRFGLNKSIYVSSLIFLSAYDLVRSYLVLLSPEPISTHTFGWLFGAILILTLTYLD